jgi:nitric oxide reductase activation protein
MRSLVRSTVGKKVKVVSGDLWCCDVKRGVIYYPSSGPFSIDVLTETQIKGILIHEVGHALYTKGIKDEHLLAPKKDYMLLLNCLEDLRIERQLMCRFPGTWDNFNKLLELSEPIIMASVDKVPEHISFLMNVRQIEWGRSIMPKTPLVKSELNRLTPAFKKALSADSTLEMDKIIKKSIWEDYKKLFPKKEQSDGSGGDSEGGKKEEADKTEGSGGEKKSSSTKERIAEEIMKKLEDVKDLRELLEVLSELVEKCCSAGEKKKWDKEMKKLDKSLSVTIKERPLKDILKDRSIKEMNNEMSAGGDTEGTIKERDIEICKETFRRYNKLLVYEQFKVEIEPHISYFARKLNSIMADNKQMRVGGAFRTGKLANKLLYKWKCNNPRLFQQKLMRHHKNYSVTLLVDESGSMTSGEKNKYATQATVLLSEVLNRIDIPFEICAFNKTERIYKHFDEPYSWAVKRNMENIMPSCSTCNAGDNNDGYAINWATERLSKRQGEKILIVLSDGRPVPSYGDIPAKEKKRFPPSLHKYRNFDLRTEILKASKSVLPIGIGILSKHVQEFYPQNIVVDKIWELPPKLLRILQNNIKRG